MEMKPQLTPALETGLMSATASFQDPEVTLSASDGDAPALCIEEAGVAVELEFPDVECVLCFQQRVAPLRLSERPATALPSGGNNAPAPRGKR